MMNNPVNRRQILKLGLAASIALPLGRAASALGDGAAPAHFPVAIRDEMLKRTAKPDIWSALKFVGADGFESQVIIDMTLPGMFHPAARYTLAAPEGIDAYKHDLQANNVTMLTFMMGNQLETRLEEELAWMKKLGAACQKLGVKTVRIDVAPKKMPKDQFLPYAISACKRMAAIAADSGVRLGIENHGKVTNDPDFLEKLFDGAGAPNLGLTLDTANFYWYGHPLKNLYGYFRKFSSRIFHTHCKSIKYPDDVKNTQRQMGWKYGEYTRPIYEGDIDFAQVAQILRDASYTGDLCLEDESLHHTPKDQQPDVLKKEIDYLRKLA